MLAGLTEREAQLARDSENVAMLVDRDDFWLNSEYAQWTTDPDDPEFKAERALRKKQGIKPPATPLLRPVAHRPPKLAQKMAELYMAAAVPEKPKIHTNTKMSTKEFAALFANR